MNHQTEGELIRQDLGSTIRSFNYEHALDVDKLKGVIKRLTEEKTTAEIEASNLRNILAQ